MNQTQALLIVTVFSFCLSATHARATTFADWTSVDTTSNLALGTIGPVSVTFSGTDIDQGVTDGSSTIFDLPLFTPPLSQSDFVGFRGAPATYQYDLVFSAPVIDPVMHLRSVASVLTFSTDSITKLSGDPLFQVAENVVTGVIDDTPLGYDTNGTLLFSGIFDSISFSVTYPNPPLIPIDGIAMQVGGNPVPIPGTLLLLMSGLGAAAGVMQLTKRSRRTR